jgi:hypothetical protein
LKRINPIPNIRHNASSRDISGSAELFGITKYDLCENNLYEQDCPNAVIKADGSIFISATTTSVVNGTISPG